MKLSAKFRPRLVDLPRIHVKGLFTYTKLIQLNNNNNLKKNDAGSSMLLLLLFWRMQ